MNMKNISALAMAFTVLSAGITVCNDAELSANADESIEFYFDKIDVTIYDIADEIKVKMYMYENATGFNAGTFKFIYDSGLTLERIEKGDAVGDDGVVFNANEDTGIVGIASVDEITSGNILTLVFSVDDKQSGGNYNISCEAYDDFAQGIRGENILAPIFNNTYINVFGKITETTEITTTETYGTTMPSETTTSSIAAEVTNDTTSAETTSSESDIIFSVDKQVVTDYNAGDEIKVNLVLDEGNIFNSGSFTFSYDSALTLKKLDVADGNEGAIAIINIDDNYISVNNSYGFEAGNVITLTFVIDNPSSDTTYPVKCYTSGKIKKYSDDFDEIVLTPEFITGYIYVMNITGENGEIMYGDANGDGYIDVRDVTAMAQHIVKMNQLEDELFRNADVNCDGAVDVKDLSQLKKYLINAIQSL